MSIGPHIYKNGHTYADALRIERERAEENGIKMTATQIYGIGPRSTAENMTQEESEEFHAAAHGINVLSHSCYFDNPWSAKVNFAIHNIKKGLRIANSIGAQGLVLHLAKRSPADIVAVLPRLVPHIRDTYLYLEIEGYKSHPYCTYDTPDKINALFRELDVQKYDPDKKIGLCIDSAHIHAAGTDIRSRESAQRWLNGIFTGEAGERSIVFHLNDQKNALGSGKDVHAPLTFGDMWSKYNMNTGTEPIADSGLVAFLNTIVEGGHTAILERHDDRPKCNGLPACSNIVSDYMVLRQLGYFTI